MARGKSQGFQSRNRTEQKVRTGKGGRAANPGYVAQLGQRVGNHITDKRGASDYAGEIFHKDPAYNPVKFGNEVARNVGAGGPGKGRDFISKCGTQGTQGAVNPGSPRTVPGKGNKDSLIDSFGPSYRGSGRG
jgi:hypothetical protein